MKIPIAAEPIKRLVDSANHIVIIQADNPDADSLGSSLALEHILGDMGKQVSLYCGVEIPHYLRYLDGWDRVSSELPRQFDASVFVDVSTYTLMEKLRDSGHMGWVAAKPSLILDHHSSVDNELEFAESITVRLDTVSSTGELIYHTAQRLAWPVNVAAAAFLTTAILGDTQGLANDLATPETYRVIATLIEQGVSRPEIEERRREFMKMAPAIFKYKAQLIERTELTAAGRLAVVAVPQTEITLYSPLYNPVPLIQNDMLSIKDVAMAIVFKHYDDGKVTGAIRCNNGFPIAAKLAEQFNGGGHPYASGFKLITGRPFNEIKSECIRQATDLLNNADKEVSHETIQHPNTST